MLFLPSCLAPVQEEPDADATSALQPRDRPEHEPVPRDTRPLFVIVSLGDSFAAGEGNPDVEKIELNAPEWHGPGFGRGLSIEDANRCHNSRNNFHAVAARIFQARHPELHVEFISFACSGAKITEEGILAPYNGVEPNVTRPPMPAQIDQVNEWADDWGLTKIDAMLISIGVNDVGFGTVVEKCAVSPFSQCNEDRELASDVQRNVASLPMRYSRLFNAIRGRGTPHLDVAPRKVFLTNYPDPTTGKYGQACSGSDFDPFEALGSLSVEETEWAQNQVFRPLNRAIGQSGFRVVDIDGGEFSRRGVCAPANSRYFNTNADAVRRQGANWPRTEGVPVDALWSTGMMHPNIRGHELAGKRLADAVLQEF